MTSRTHDLAAFTALVAIVCIQPAHVVTFSTLLLALLANQIGGIAPDIDQPTAPFWRNLPIGGPIGKVFDKLLGGHRFLTHSVLGVVLFGYLAKVLLHVLQPLVPHANIGFVLWAFLIGMVSHLIMDTLTKEGVPWLLPIPYKFGFPPVKAFRITTGKKGELLIVFPLLLVLCIWLIAEHSQKLLLMLHHTS